MIDLLAVLLIVVVAAAMSTRALRSTVEPSPPATRPAADTSDAA